MDAIIFDMDGLLIDSEPLWVRAEIEVFGAHGVVLVEADCAQTKGLRTDDVVAHWHATRGFVGVALADVETRLIARVAALIAEEGIALAGVAHAIALAKASGARVALASSSPPRVIESALSRLGIGDAFALVQSAAGEPYGKPHPGVFLTTAAKLGVSPLRSVVLEDSLNGVIAAKAARMRCIAVPPAEHREDPRFTIADALLSSLAELTPALLEA